MTFWQTLWTILFFSSLALFAILAVTVSIGGFLNIRWMLARLKAQNDPDDSDMETPNCHIS